jgi:hypothetical protein
MRDGYEVGTMEMEEQLLSAGRPKLTTPTHHPPPLDQVTSALPIPSALPSLEHLLELLLGGVQAFPGVELAGEDGRVFGLGFRADNDGAAGVGNEGWLWMTG